MIEHMVKTTVVNSCFMACSLTAIVSRKMERIQLNDDNEIEALFSSLGMVADLMMVFFRH